MSVNSRRTNRIILIIIGLVVGFIFLAVMANQATTDGSLKGKVAVVYRSATCGCCGNYITYLRKAGVKVEEKITNDMTAIRKQFGVPEELSSCHTVRMEDYTIEGHMPIEAIQKLLTEKSSIAGIALPKMPSGSPGMPGAKYETFDVYSFDSYGSSSPYISI
jgi:hypothetical protein